MGIHSRARPTIVKQQFINSKCYYWKLYISVDSVWYLKYINRNTAAVVLVHIQFTPNFICKLVYTTLSVTTEDYKSKYCGLGLIESPIHTKFDIYACLLTLNKPIKNYRHRSTGSGTSHISQIGKLLSWVHGKSDSHQIWYLGLYSNSK